MASMHEQELKRLRGLLASGDLSDAAFDLLLPLAARASSTFEWTPLRVARIAALRLAEAGARNVLDVGSGPGKFCIVAALTCPQLTFVGVEQRSDLVVTARTIGARLQVPNARFDHGDALSRSWAPFDGFYCFNPFAESALVTSDAPAAVRDEAMRRLGAEALGVTQRLRQARRASVLVTYHGLGGVIPSSYELMAEEESGSGCLRTWVKTRDREQAWVYLDYGAVSRSNVELQDGLE